jgi:cytochrome c5
MLKPVLLVSAVALFAISLSAPPMARAQNASSKAKASADSQSKAKKIYALDCALCHGATGDGKTDLAKDMQLNMDDWSDAKTLSSVQDDALFKTIREGKGKMPPEDKGRATDDEVRNLIVYIRSLGKAEPASAPAATPTAAPAPAPSASPAPGN